MIRKFIVQDLLNKDDLDGFSDDYNLLEAGLDSLGIMRLVDFIENEYGVVLPDEEVISVNMKNIHTIESLISRYLKK